MSERGHRISKKGARMAYLLRYFVALFNGRTATNKSLGFLVDKTSFEVGIRLEYACEESFRLEIIYVRKFGAYICCDATPYIFIDLLFSLGSSKVELICKVGQSLYNYFEWNIFLVRWSVRRAERSNCLDALGIKLCESPDNCTSPVMADDGYSG